MSTEMQAISNLRRGVRESSSESQRLELELKQKSSVVPLPPKYIPEEVVSKITSDLEAALETERASSKSAEELRQALTKVRDLEEAVEFENIEIDALRATASTPAPKRHSASSAEANGGGGCIDWEARAQNIINPETVVNNSSNAETCNIHGEEDDEGDLLRDDDVVIDDAIVNARSSVNVRPKSLKVPSFPACAQLPCGKIHMATNLAHASKNGDNIAISWSKECVVQTFEELGDPGSTRMRHLDSLIASAFIDMLPGKLKEEVRRMHVNAMEFNKIIAGRQMCREMCKRIATSDQRSVVFGVDDLINLEWLGGEKMDEFVDMWKWIHTNMLLGTHLLDDARRDIFIVQIEKSVVLKEDIAHYHRYKNSD
jgi:hypothetical protein